MSLWKFGTGNGAHALVVGVGHYPALPGGGGALYPQHGGMGQLTSAAPSALAFADWLTKTYRSATAPLRSLELLISDSAAVTYTAKGKKQDVNRATFDALEQAVGAWHERLDKAPENRAIFYFCGHGVSAGLQATLLCEDYGTVPAKALASALDFSTFQRAMDQCKAREQVFLVDACRVASPTVVNAINYFGNPILTPGMPTSPPRKSPVVYSALPGTAAYGQAEKPSYFTEALLRALRGAGAGRKGGSWTILPSVLYRSLTRLLDQAIAGTGATQGCTVDQLTDFDLHDLGGPPEVPVNIDCNPPIDLAVHTVKVTSAADNREQAPPVPKPWSLDLPSGQYRFVASSPAGAVCDVTDIVFPPFTDVVLP